MDDKAYWTPAHTLVVQVDALSVPEDYPSRSPEGWWVLPFVLAGALSWFGLISLVF